MGDTPNPTSTIWSNGAATSSTTPTTPGATGPGGCPGLLLKGVAYDTPIQGYGVNTCNVLTLWSARAVESFALEAFNTGDYYKAVEDEVTSETVTKVLYPNDEPEAGKRLRLLQQYFFVSCSLQHVLHIMDDLADAGVRELPQRFAMQLNDTHPSIGVAELMRLLVDERLPGVGRGVGHHRRDVRLHQPHPAAGGAGDLAAGACSASRCRATWRSSTRSTAGSSTRCAPDSPATTERVRRMSLIGEDGAKNVRMAHLATVGSHAINGVAALHSELLKESVLKDFYEMWPERFSNKTNGVTPRRFLALSNPGLRELLDRTIGDGWLTDLGQAARAGAVRRRRLLPGAVARCQAQQQGAAGQRSSTRRPASS